jgi:hypothetical protein
MRVERALRMRMERALRMRVEGALRMRLVKLRKKEVGVLRVLRG